MKITTKIVTRSAFILALAIAAQLVKLPQPVTGPVINALLFLAAGLIGPISAVLIGLCTPVIAFVFGIMPFAPAVPIIMLGNAALALTFGLLVKKPYLGLVAASLAKYGIMALSVFYVFPGLFNINIPAKFAAALTTPQLFTAFSGAIPALIIIKAVQHFMKEETLADF